MSMDRQADLDFFEFMMSIALERCQAECLRKANLTEGDEAVALANMAQHYESLSANTSHALTSGQRDAMGHALLTMQAINWERFYQGYVAWSKSRANNYIPGQEEENARGSMLLALLALKERWQAGMRTLEQAGPQSRQGKR